MIKGKIAFVLGVAHSGTTIVYRLLGRHPSLAWFSQFSQRGGTIPGRTKLPLWGFYNRLARRIFGVPWKKERGLGEYFIPRPMEANKIWDYLLPPKENDPMSEPSFWERSDVTPELRRRARLVINRELDAWGRSYLINKLPRLSCAVPALEELFDRTKYIHLLRDGRSVAFSLAHKFETGDRSHLTSLRDAARHWQSVVEFVEDTISEILNPDDLLRLKLESFQRNPEREFSRVLDFLELDSFACSALSEVETGTNQKWKARSTRKETAMLENMLEDTLRQLGYCDSWLN